MKPSGLSVSNNKFRILGIIIDTFAELRENSNLIEWYLFQNYFSFFAVILKNFQENRK